MFEMWEISILRTNRWKQKAMRGIYKKENRKWGKKMIEKYQKILKEVTIMLIIILILTIVETALYVKRLKIKDVQIREKIVEIDNLKEIVNEKSKEE